MALNPKIEQWQGLVVWLVGASTGIGRATAHALHAAGATVIVSARTQAKLDDFVHSHPGSVAEVLDVTDAASVRRACEAIVQRQGRIDLTVYCAGHYSAMDAQHFDLAQAITHQRVNVHGVLHWLDAVLPPLQHQAKAGGMAHLSIVASVAGYRGLPQALAYGPTKAALINMAEVLYLDLAAQGVAVSLICPGFVDTPMAAGNTFAMPALLTPEQAAQAILRGWRRGAFEIHFPKRFTWPLKLMQLLSNRLYLGIVRRAIRP